MRLRFLTFAASLVAASLATLASHGDASAQASRQAPREAKSVDGATGKAVGPLERLTVVADRDDDDLDGTPDAEEAPVPVAARVDAIVLDARYAGATLTPRGNAERARLLAPSGKVVPWGDKVPAGALLQGVIPGRLSLLAETAGREWTLAVEVHGIGLRDGEHKAVDLARSHASIERTPPTRVDLADADATYDDPDALRLVVASPDGATLGPLTADSLSADGVTLDVLRDVRLLPVPCEGAGGAAGCFATAPLRLVVDDVDRNHPLVASRSMRSEVGGALVVRDANGKKLQAIRVAGPRASSVGPIGRQRLTIHPVVMRMGPGAAPAVGGTDAGAVAALRAELALASATWGQCGISFGPVTQMDVKVMSPPPPYLVSIGDDVGLPASGGVVHLRVEGRALDVTTRSGWSTRQVALEMQRVVTAAGFGAVLSENARIGPGAASSVDLALRRRDGQLASAEITKNTDRTLSVSVGAVDLADGLQHFGDTDSVAGTIEERALVKAVDDGDPRTIELIVVPFFSGGGRIGESFIGSDGSSMRNVVILDRAGVRARRTSLTLAHELGHVILDEPGHPDDYGIDTPTLLMDSDASDSSPFGPRRLGLDECGRAVKQAGPDARFPLLTEWKLTPMKYPTR